MPLSSENEAVLPQNLGGGPHGLGDPNDKSLRKVERDVLVPKKIREKARLEKCVKEVEEFNQCCRGNKLLFVVNCRNENTLLKECLGKWYQNEEFRDLCTEEYLNERSEYRRTGILKKHRGLNLKHLKISENVN